MEKREEQMQLQMLFSMSLEPHGIKGKFWERMKQICSRMLCSIEVLMIKGKTHKCCVC